MTNEIFPNKDLLFQNHHFPVIYQESASPQPCVGTSHNQDFPSRKRQTFYRWCSRITASGFADSDLVIEYIYGKYIQNLSIHTIRQSSSIILSFLVFLDKNHQTIYDLTRQNISSFVDNEQDRGLQKESIIHHLEALYAFIAFLVEQEVLPYSIRQHKIKLKKPDSLPRAIPSEDIQSLLATISNIRDRALILLLLRTGMRIGELLEVKISDIIFSERKILIYQGEKNYQGRIVYYSEDAEYPQLDAWCQDQMDRELSWVKDDKVWQTRTMCNRLRLWKDAPEGPELVNTPIQGTAADVLKIALGQAVRRFEGMDAKIIACVHDEIVVETDREIATTMRDVLEDTMISAASELLASVPVEVDLTIADSWLS